MRAALAIGLIAAGCSGRVDQGPDLRDAAVRVADLGPVRDATVLPDLVHSPPPGKITDFQGWIAGVTNDGWAVLASNFGFGTLQLSGGAEKPVFIFPKSMVDPASNPSPNPVVFFTNIPGYDFEVWSSSGGLQVLSPKALLQPNGPGDQDATSDGSYIAYLGNATMTSVDVVIDHVDHSAPHVVATVAPKLWLQFAAGRLVLWHSAPGTSSPTTISSYDPATGDGIDLANVVGVPPDNNSFAGPYVLASLTPGQASLVPIAGGNPIPLIPGDFRTGRFVGDGSAVLFQDLGENLSRVELDGTPPILLQPVAHGLLVSPDGRFVLSSTTAGAPQIPHDLYLASATAPGAPQSLTTNMVQPYASVGFTADSGYAFFVDHALEDSFGLYLGELEAVATDGGAVTPIAADTVFAQATEDSKILVFDHCISDGTCDLEQIDLSTGSVYPIASGFWEEPSLFYVPQLKSALYVWNGAIYLTPLP
jgi:hypothetical protein